MLRNLFSDESGVVISAELVVVLTVAVLAMVVGLSEVAVAINTELNDLSNGVGALSQTFEYTGFGSVDSAGNTKSTADGGIFYDETDDCDANTSCDIVGDDEEG